MKDKQKRQYLNILDKIYQFNKKTLSLQRQILSWPYCLKNEYEDQEVKIRFNALLKNSITIKDKSTFLEESINQLCNYYQTQKKSFDANYLDIITEIKKNVCLICCHKMDDYQEDKITVPCGCNFCSNHHFEFFFNQKKPIQIEK